MCYPSFVVCLQTFDPIGRGFAVCAFAVVALVRRICRWADCKSTTLEQVHLANQEPATLVESHPEAETTVMLSRLHDLAYGLDEMRYCMLLDVSASTRSTIVRAL